MRRLALLTLLLFVSGCGGSPTSPTLAPTPTPTPTPTPQPPPAPTVLVFTGTVTQALNGAAVPNATVLWNATSTTTNAAGQFRFESTTARPTRLTITAPGYVTRGAAVAGTSATISLIRDGLPFELPVYRQLVRNGLEEPTNLTVLFRLTSPPRFYMRTLDETGQPVPSVDLATVREWIPRGLSQWVNWTMAGWEEGPEARARASGTINIIFTREPSGDYCGRAFLAAPNGQITFNLAIRDCACGALHFSPRTVLHELGHALAPSVKALSTRNRSRFRDSGGRYRLRINEPLAVTVQFVATH